MSDDVSIPVTQGHAYRFIRSLFPSGHHGEIDSPTRYLLETLVGGWMPNTLSNYPDKEDAAALRKLADVLRQIAAHIDETIDKAGR